MVPTDRFLHGLGIMLGLIKARASSANRGWGGGRWRSGPWGEGSHIGHIATSSLKTLTHARRGRLAHTHTHSRPDKDADVQQGAHRYPKLEHWCLENCSVGSAPSLRWACPHPAVWGEQECKKVKEPTHLHPLSHYILLHSSFACEMSTK